MAGDTNTQIEKLSEKFDMLMKKFDAQAMAQAKEVKELKKIMMDQINKKIETVTLKFDEKIKSLEEKLEFSSEFAERRCNVLINGIPATNEENIIEIMSKLSAALGFKSSPEHKAFRYKGIDDSKSPILVRFMSPFGKDSFVNNYIKVARTFTLDKVGLVLGNTGRIFIQNDMSKRQYELSKAALKMKKGGKIKNVNLTQYGILVRFTDGQSKIFTAVKQLQEFIKSTSTEDV